MAEANLVNGDLVEILADWKEKDTENKGKHRLALACGKPPQLPSALPDWAIGLYKTY